MTQKKYTRKLTAILSADVVGYSRLMGEDEEATVETLTAYREFIRTLIIDHKGRVVNAPGDNILAEFASVVAAMRCAWDVQLEIKARNAQLPENRRMHFRMGVNLGDVIEEEGRIYGDGVNIAARLEGLADAGGICISGTAYDQVKNKLPFSYSYEGEQTVKNIADPVRVYRVLMEPDTAAEMTGIRKTPVRKWMPAAVAVLTAVILVVIVAITYNLYLRPGVRSKSTAPKLISDAELSKKPSLAVLPFDNLSEDPAQAYFSDGLTEDLITGLSKIKEILVIARNSTFAYKGKSVEIQKVAQELGVKYVLEGSVRRAEDQVRINAQLIDATTGSHLWAERYDGQMADIFALQDQINDKIIAALALKLTAVEKQRLAHKETNNLTAYDAFLKGWEHYKRTTPDDFAKALSDYEEATQLDPVYARANAALALLYWRASMLGWNRRLHYAHFQQARFQARKYLALAIKEPTSIAYQVSALILLFQRLHQQAITDADKALSLAPNDAYSHFIMAMILNYAGQHEKATDYVKRAMRLDPHYPADYVFLLGEIQFAMGKLEEAMTFFEKALKRNPEVGGMGGRYPLIATYALLGRDQEARAILEPIKRASTIFQVYLGRSMYFNPYKNPEVAARLAEGLIKAGVSTEHEAFSEYYTVSDEDRIDGEEIRALVFGRTRTGLERWLSGLQWWIECAQNGEGVYDGSEKGRHWVENDMLCHQWETSIWGMRWFEIPLRDVKYCGPVFRNPQGRPEKLNEYLEIPVWAIYPWSIEE